MRHQNRRKKLGAGERKLLKVIGQQIGQVIHIRGESVHEVSVRAKVARSTIREVINGESNVGIITFCRILDAIDARAISNYLTKSILIGT